MPEHKSIHVRILPPPPPPPHHPPPPPHHHPTPPPHHHHPTPPPHHHHHPTPPPPPPPPPNPPPPTTTTQPPHHHHHHHPTPPPHHHHHPTPPPTTTTTTTTPLHSDAELLTSTTDISQMQLMFPVSILCTDDIYLTEPPHSYRESRMNWDIHDDFHVLIAKYRHGLLLKWWLSRTYRCSQCNSISNCGRVPCALIGTTYWKVYGFKSPSFTSFYLNSCCKNAKNYQQRVLV